NSKVMTSFFQNIASIYHDFKSSNLLELIEREISKRNPSDLVSIIDGTNDLINLCTKKEQKILLQNLSNKDTTKISQFASAFHQIFNRLDSARGLRDKALLQSFHEGPVSGSKNYQRAENIEQVCKDYLTSVIRLTHLREFNKRFLTEKFILMKEIQETIKFFSEDSASKHSKLFLTESDKKILKNLNEEADLKQAALTDLEEKFKEVVLREQSNNKSTSPSATLVPTQTGRTFSTSTNSSASVSVDQFKSLDLQWASSVVNRTNNSSFSLANSLRQFSHQTNSMQTMPDLVKNIRTPRSFAIGVATAGSVAAIAYLGSQLNTSKESGHVR
ncbi:hypothetical protein OAP83_03105, partial [Rickettsiales bacterium]|nr:hypothetical protein [Rickettsiales bacterium]